MNIMINSLMFPDKGYVKIQKVMFTYFQLVQLLIH